MNQYSLPPWIGSLPSSWRAERIGRILNHRNERNDALEVNNILSVMKNVGVIRYEDKGNVGNKKSDRPENYKIVYPNDIVLNSMNFVIGSVGIAREKGVTSSVYYIIYPKNTEEVDPEYLKYVFYSKTFQKYAARLGKGIMELRESIKWPDLKQELIPLPPFGVQKKIAGFLDQKTAKIDQLIQKNKKLIKLLEEKRQVIITQAVTKGLDPNVKMKNSGVEWVGKVPKTWNVRRIKTIVKEHYSGIWGGEGIGDSNDILCLRVADFDYNNLCSISPKTIRNVEGKARLKKLLRKRDIVLEKSGGGDKTPVGRQILYDLGIKAVSSNFTQVIRLKNLITAEYYVYFCSAQYSKKINIRSIKQTTGIQNIDINLYFNEPITLPSVEEQKRIANYLNDKTFQIRALISKIKLQNKKLEEYRQALISNAVTGKIKV